MIDELRTPEMLQKLGEWRSSGWSWTKMASAASADTGKKIDVPTVKRAYDIAALRTTEIIAGDEELKGKLVSVVFDQAERLKKITKVCDDLLDELMESKKDPHAILGAMREVRDQIRLQKELLDRMNEGFDVKHINRLEYTNISINNLNELEKSGYIKILRKPGQPYDPEAKEVVMLTAEQLKELNKKGILMLGNFCIQITDEDEEEEEIEAEIVAE